jgi:hypothetical protein
MMGWEMQALRNANALHRPVQSGYWKIIFVQLPKRADSIRVAALMVDRATLETDKVIAQIATANEIDRRSGFDFLRELWDDIEEQIEGDQSSDWAVVHLMSST